MDNIKLRLPLKDIFIVQPFGTNYLSFYTDMGLVAHNGVDFRAKDGCPIYATHDGVVGYAGKDGDGGISVTLINEEEHYKTIYYHNKKNLVKKGDKVKAGDLICLADNTGKYTTGSHLHFGLKRLDDQNFNTLDLQNGYRGAIDPAPYFFYTYDGTEIKNKDWDKCRAYHRYNMEKTSGHEWVIGRNIWVAFKRFGRFAKPEELNALVYGNWDYESVKNPAMYELWSQITINEYKKGDKPFQ